MSKRGETDYTLAATDWCNDLQTGAMTGHWCGTVTRTYGAMGAAAGLLPRSAVYMCVCGVCVHVYIMYVLLLYAYVWVCLRGHVRVYVHFCRCVWRGRNRPRDKSQRHRHRLISHMPKQRYAHAY